MRALLARADAVHLDLSEYEADIRTRVRTIDGPVTRIERIQTFQEPGSRSWTAFRDGRWADALCYAEQLSYQATRLLRRLSRAGWPYRRVRVVELPLTTCLQWELHTLRPRVRAGERVRVLDAARISDLEERVGLVPEVTVLGSKVLYETEYDRLGVPVEVRRIDHPAVVDECRRMVATLFDRAEELDTFFYREVEDLPAPIAVL